MFKDKWNWLFASSEEMVGAIKLYRALASPLMFTVLCALSFLPTHSQYVNVQIDPARRFAQYQPCEPSIAISRKDPNVMVAGAVLDRVYVSQDGGVTWTADQLRSEFGVYGDPCIVSGRKGDFYYFHLSDPSGKGWGGSSWLDRIVCQRSKDNGLTWDAGHSIGLNGKRQQDKQWGATSFRHNKVFATWTQFDVYASENPGDSSLILFSSSGRNVKKWCDPIRISQRAGDCLDDDNTVEGAVPTTGPGKEVYVSWALGNHIWFDRSADKGKSWLDRDIMAGEIIGGWSLDIPGLYRCNGMPVTVCDVSGGPNHGAIYINWSDQRNGENDTDIWLIRSDDKGDTWSKPVRVNNDEGAAHQFFTWMTVDQKTGVVYVVFYDRRNHDDLNTDVYMAWSDDGGKTFVNEKISEKPFETDPFVFFGDYINVAAWDGMVRPIWMRNDDGALSIWTAIINR